MPGSDLADVLKLMLWRDCVLKVIVRPVSESGDNGWLANLMD